MTTIVERREGILRAEGILAEAPRSLTVGHLLAALAEMGPIRVTYTLSETGRRMYELMAVEASEDDRFLLDPAMRLRLQTKKATTVRSQQSHELIERARAMRAAGHRWKAIGTALDRDPEYLRKAVAAAISSRPNEPSG